MRVLSLFDGMSMGQIALWRAGIWVDTYYASEIESWPMTVTNTHFPKTIQLGDVCKVVGSSLGEIDLLMGGSPCQSFSNAGKGEGFSGKSGLFYEYLRLLREVKPKYFLLENVKMKGLWRDVISQEMGVEPILINSSLVSAQNRERYYWTNIPGITQPQDKGILLKDILFTGIGGKYILSEKRKALVLHGKKYGASNKICDWNGKSQCLMAGMGMGGGIEPKVWDSGELRRITPIECERLQTVPDDWTNVVNERGKRIGDGQRYKMLGNGWTVDVISHILSHMKGV